MAGRRIDSASPVIRSAGRADLPALVQLLGALFAIEADFFFDAEKQRRGLSLMLDGCGKHRQVLVAEAGGEVIGMCSGQLLISTAEGAVAAMVEDMVVREDCRGAGVGAMLLKAIGAWARQRGAVRLQLLADLDNAPAIEFYRGRGWNTTRLICLRKR